jgi:polysaccharide transporter, PST family
MMKNVINNLTCTQKRIVKNIFSLSLLQGANYLLPLLTVPYLIRVLGIEYFGLLAFVTAVITYFLVLTDYGFNLSATSKVANNRNDINKVNEIFSSVLTIKLVLVVLGFLLLLVIAAFIPRMQSDINIYVYTYGMVVGQALMPLWLFQGLEKMKYVTYFNVIAKFIATGLIFILVQEQSDYIVVPILISLGFIIAGILSLIFARKEFNMRFLIPTKAAIIENIEDGWHVFLNNFFVNLYSTTNIIVLGFLTNNTIVGFYSLAEKIIGAISGLFVPVTQSFYPYMSSLHQKCKGEFEDVFIRLIIVFSATCSILFFTIYMFGHDVIKLVSGGENSDIVDILTILSIGIFTSPLGTLFTQAFIIKKQTKRFLKVVQYTFLTNVVLIFPLVYFDSLLGMAYTVFIAQLVHMFFNTKYYFFYLRRI